MKENYKEETKMKKILVITVVVLVILAVSLAAMAQMKTVTRCGKDSGEYWVTTKNVFGTEVTRQVSKKEYRDALNSIGFAGNYWYSLSETFGF